MTPYALGVDLGTTYTAAAVARGITADPLPLGADAAAFPSVVFVRDDGEVLVGDAAERRASTEPTRVAREFKRRLGDPVPMVVGGVARPVQELMADVLREVVRRATEQEGAPPAAVVLTHPANWTSFKLDLLREAARSAGLDADRVALLAEPEAAAVAYTRLRPVEVGELIAVHDFGGGTFDAAVVRRTDTGFELVGTPEGLERLGGIDIDQAVLAHVDQALAGLVSGADRSDPQTLPALARLRLDCRRAKEALSADADTTVAVALPGVHTEVRVTRPEIEAMVRPRVAETVRALERTVVSSGSPMDAISRVLLVGGTSRMPLVGEMVREATGRPVAVDVHPKLAIALGAALVGAGRLAEADADVDAAAAASTESWRPPGRVAPPPPAPSSPAPSGRRRVVVAVAAAVTALVAAGVVLLVGGGDDDEAAPPATTAPVPATTEPETTEPPATTVDTDTTTPPSGPVVLAELNGVVAAAPADGDGIVAVTDTGAVVLVADGEASVLAELGGPAGGVAALPTGEFLVTVGADVVRVPVEGGPAETALDGATVEVGANPGPIAVDGAGNAYLVDNDNHRVIRLAADGSLRLVAGNGTAADGTASGDGEPAVAVALGSITGLAIDRTGALLIADATTRSVRAVTADGTITTRATGFASVDALTVEPGGPVYVADGVSGALVEVGSDGSTTIVADTTSVGVRLRALAWVDGLVGATGTALVRFG